MGGLPIVLPDPCTFSGIAYDCFLRHVRDVILRKSIASFMSCDCSSDSERNPGVTCRMPERGRYFWLLPIIADTLSNRHPTGPSTRAEDHCQLEEILCLVLGLRKDCGRQRMARHRM